MVGFAGARKGEGFGGDKRGLGREGGHDEKSEGTVGGCFGSSTGGAVLCCAMRCVSHSCLFPYDCLFQRWEDVTVLSAMSLFSAKG